jgi:hypothetical protein
MPPRSKPFTEPDPDESLPTGEDELEVQPVQQVNPEPAPAPPSPVQTLDPLQVMAQLAAGLQALAARQDSNDERQQELMATLGSAMARIAESNIKGSEQIAAEMRRSQRPSNEIVPMRSVFNQRGVLLDDNHKPPLKCIMFIPWMAEWDSLTREEVELLNLLEPGEYRVTQNDGEEYRITIKAEFNLDGKTMSRLLMNHPTAFTQENFRKQAPLRMMLREIIEQIPGSKPLLAAVLTEKEEAAMIAAGQLAVSA